MQIKNSRNGRNGFISNIGNIIKGITAPVNFPTVYVNPTPIDLN